MVQVSTVAHSSRINAARFLLVWSRCEKSVQLLEQLLSKLERIETVEPTHTFHALIAEANIQLVGQDPATTDVERVVECVWHNVMGTMTPEVSSEAQSAFDPNEVLGEFTGESAIKCRHCKSGEVTYVSLQTRASDEDPRYFYKCLNKKCGKIW